MNGVNRSLLFGVVAIFVVFGLIVNHTSGADTGFSPGGIATASTQNDQLSIIVKCATTMVSGKENVLEVRVKNRGNRVLEYYQWNDLHDVTLKVKKFGRVDNGFTHLYINWTDRLSDLGRNNIRLRLEPGGELLVVVNLSRMLDLSQPGPRELSVIWTGMVSGKEETVAIEAPPLNPSVIEEVPHPFQ